MTNEVLGKARSDFDEFMSLSMAGKADALADVVVAGVTAYVVAGGADVEGGLCDTDLLLGIGNHRNPFSHTILCALTVEGGIRFTAAGLSRLHEHLPEDHDLLWDGVLDVFNRTYEAAIVGVWLGTAAHLLKDANLPGVKTKPYTSLPVSLSNAGHQALFATNGAVSGALGTLTGSGKKAYTRCGQ